MTLDKLYDLIKDAKYPINNRDEVTKIIGENTISFENSNFTGKNIGLAIEKYPIHKPADFIKFFIEAFEEFNK